MDMPLSSSDQLSRRLSTPKRFGSRPSSTASSSDSNSRIERVRVEDESEIEKVYQLGEVLGRGAFGVVREVTKKDTGERFAMKIVNKDKPGSISIQLLEREVEVLKRVNHSSIIQLEAVYETAKKMYMIMELCLGGELSDELKRRTYFKEEDAKPVMKKIVEAVVYLHDNDVVHRDLKLENVLRLTSDPNDPTIKVTDFGLAVMKGLPGCCDDLMDSKCGTPYYMAPEVLNNRHEYTKMCDVWSLGVIMYSLFCGKFPFQSNNSSKLEELVQKGELTFPEIEWINVSQAAKDLLQNMLCVDTTSRYTARRILDDPWFTGNPSKRTINALDLMRNMDSETENQTSIVVSSPSTNQLAIATSPTLSASFPCAALPQPVKVQGCHSHTTTLPVSTHKNSVTPTRNVGSNPKALKSKASSSSSLSISGSSSKGSSTSPQSSSSSITSPTHKHSISSSSVGISRPRGSTFTTGCKSQSTLSPTRKIGTSGEAGLRKIPESIPRKNCESVSSSQRERKLTSPSRTNAPRTNT